MQAVALLLAPITVVQPALAVSIIALLFIGCRWFDQTARTREVLAALAIAIGVGGLVAGSPGHSEGDGEPLALAVGLTVLGLVALSPFALRGRRRVGGLVALSAGLAYAWAALGPSSSPTACRPVPGRSRWCGSPPRRRPPSSAW